jgi:biofilm PGA synthesis N-glycosyltransferase PgaC
MADVIGDILIYASIFIGLFVSFFYIIILFSDKYTPPKRTKKRYTISVVIPFWNEGSQNGERLRKTVESILAVDYPKELLQIILVNDGSTDNSLEIAKSYEKEDLLVLSHDESKGKTIAVNTGINRATGELVVGLDADSFVLPDIFMKLIPSFLNPKVMAAIPSVKIWNPKGILQKIQYQEFLSANFIRYLQSKLGFVPLAPGAFTLVRKSFIDKHGLLSHKTMVEDLELSMRIQSEGYLIDKVVSANVYTSGVSTIKAFVNQRLRWFCGFIIQIRNYKHLFNKKYSNLAFFILPSAILFIGLTIVLFMYAVVQAILQSIKFIENMILIGFDPSKWFEFQFDIFFLSINNKTILPILLLIIALLFTLYIRKISEEKQGVIVPFIVFMLTYWFAGAICWILAAYYYVRKKPVKWGPNYFTQ